MNATDRDPSTRMQMQLYDRKKLHRPRLSEQTRRLMRRNGYTNIVDYFQARLPYGKWECEDGREVLFNRFYQPIWTRGPIDIVWHPADRTEFVRGIEDTYYYYKSSTCPPWRDEVSLRWVLDRMVALGVIEHDEGE